MAPFDVNAVAFNEDMPILLYQNGSSLGYQHSWTFNVRFLDLGDIVKGNLSPSSVQKNIIFLRHKVEDVLIFVIFFIFVELGRMLKRLYN